jgi:hypothetical protein
MMVDLSTPANLYYYVSLIPEVKILRDGEIANLFGMMSVSNGYFNCAFSLVVFRPTQHVLRCVPGDVV